MMMQIEMKIEFPAGAEIKDCAFDMVKMAIRLDVLVFGYFNGVHIFATENTNPDTIIDRYNKELGKKKPEPKVIWVNEYEDGDPFSYQTKEIAVRVSSGEHSRIAVKYQEVIE